MAGKNRAPAAVLRAFLAGQGDVSRAKDANGWTSLHLVCYLPFEGSEECLDVILGNGGDVAAQTVEGLTPLHLACCDGQCGAVSKLLARGARIDARSADRQTPLMFAAKLGHDQVSVFLSRGDSCWNPPAFEVPHASMLHRSNTMLILKLSGRSVPRREGAGDSDGAGGYLGRLPDSQDHDSRDPVMSALPFPARALPRGSDLLWRTLERCLLLVTLTRVVLSAGGL